VTPITFAHRGGGSGGTENTVAAFATARAKGASGVESDVRLSADGVPVLAHDRTVRAGLRRREIAGHSASDLGALGVARLDELYATVGPDLDVSLDLRVPAAADAVVEVARRASSPDRLWLCSPDLDVLTDIRARHPDVRTVHSIRRQDLDVTVERHAATLADAGIAACNLHRSEWSAGLVVLFHRFDVSAFAWDVQEVRHLREVLRQGVDAVYSDHVDRMVAVVGEWAAHPG